MANEKHLLLTWGGDYVDAPNAGEVWQNSLRLVLNFGTVDPVNTLPTNWAPVPKDVNRTETNWKITGNWSVDGPLAYTFEPDDYLNDQVAPALDTWLATSGFSDGIRMTWAKIFAIGDNGNALPPVIYSQGSPILLEWTSAYPTGDDGANLLPLQNSIVVSHRSQQTGRRGRGRIFRAGVSTNSNDAHGRIGSTYVTNMLNAQVALLEALSINAALPSTAAHVIPAVIGSPWTQYGTITQVRVGDRMDTQRRRRDQLAETYSSASPSY